MNQQKKTSKVIYLLLLMLFSAAGGGIWYYKSRPYHFLVVKPGVLYRSGWMNSNQEGGVIRKYGIKTVVNLCIPTEDTYLEKNAGEQQVCRTNGIKLVNLPLPGNTPPTREQITEWLALLGNNDNLPVLVHCAQGVTRTNAMVAIYRIEFLHEDNAKVLKEQPSFGHDLNDPKRKDLWDFVLGYKPSRKN
jgi:protein tyrosine/serine phosphatase